MFHDIVKLIQLTLVATLEDTTKEFNKKQLYDVYRKMENAISTLRVLEVHYLSLPFNNDILKDSIHEAPFQKWALFVEQDFDKVRQAMRLFLVELVSLKYQYINKDGLSESVSIMEYFIETKRIIGFFSYHYESGKLTKSEQGIFYHQLCIEEKEFYKECTIDIVTHKQRESLCKKIFTSKNEMKTIMDTLKSFILENATLEELL